MKITSIFILLLISFLFFFINCKNTIASDGLPEVKNPTYKMYDISGERGYEVSFEIKSQEPKVDAVVINGIKKKISTAETNGNKFKVNIIAQSQKISNYKPEMVKKPNGIVFKTTDGYLLEPVTFILKK